MNKREIHVNVMGIDDRFPYVEDLEALKMTIAQKHHCFCADVQIYRNTGEEVVSPSAQLKPDDEFKASIANFVAVPVSFNGAENTVLMDRNLKVINLTTAVTNGDMCDCYVNGDNVEPSTLLKDLCLRLEGKRLELKLRTPAAKVTGTVVCVDLPKREFTCQMPQNAPVAWLRFRLSQDFKIPPAEIIIRDGDREMDDTEEAGTANGLSASSKDIEVYVDHFDKPRIDRYKLRVNLFDIVWDVKVQASSLLGMEKPEKLRLSRVLVGTLCDLEPIGTANVYNGMSLTSAEDCNGMYSLIVSGLDGQEMPGTSMSGQTDVRAYVWKATGNAVGDDMRVMYKREDVTEKKLTDLEYDPLERLQLIISFKQIVVNSERQTHRFDREKIQGWKVQQLIDDIKRREGISNDTTCELLDSNTPLNGQDPVPLQTTNLFMRITRKPNEKQHETAQTKQPVNDQVEVILQDGDKTLYRWCCPENTSLKDLQAKLGLPDNGVQFLDAEKREIQMGAQIVAPGKVFCIPKQEQSTPLTYFIKEEGNNSSISIEVEPGHNVRDLKVKYVCQRAASSRTINWNLDLLFFEQLLDPMKTFGELCIPNTSCLQARKGKDTMPVRVTGVPGSEREYQMSRNDTIYDLCQLIEDIEKIPANSFSLRDQANIVDKGKKIGEAESSLQIENFPKVEIGLMTGGSQEFQVSPDQTIGGFLTEYQGKMGGKDRFGLFCNGRMLRDDQLMRELVEGQLGKLDQIEVKWNNSSLREYVCLDVALPDVIADLNDKYKWTEDPAANLAVKYDGCFLDGGMTLSQVMGEAPFKPLEILLKGSQQSSSPPRTRSNRTITAEQGAAGHPEGRDSVTLRVWLDGKQTRFVREEVVTVEKTAALSDVRSAIRKKVDRDWLERARFRYTDPKTCEYCEVVPEETLVKDLKLQPGDKQSCLNGLALVKDDDESTDGKSVDDFVMTVTTSMRPRSKESQPKNAPNPQVECKFTVQPPGESTSQIITHRFDNNARISDAKLMLSKQFNVPVDYITLLFGGRPLGNRMLLSRIHLHNKSITVYIKDLSEIILVTAKQLRP